MIRVSNKKDLKKILTERTFPPRISIRELKFLGDKLGSRNWKM